MVKQVLVALLVFMFILSCRRIKNEDMSVLKDCTGAYLRYRGKDYKVCNKEKTDGYENGAHVMATFKKVKECNDYRYPSIICGYYHSNEGWVLIDKIQ